MPDPATSGALRARRIFTAQSDEVIIDGLITFADGVITYVGPFIAPGTPPRTPTPTPTILDLGDVTILPGFVDTHAHLSLPADGRTYEAVHQESDDYLIQTGLANARRHLASGVTTVRDNGARGRVGFAIRQAAAGTQAPRILVAGRPLTPTGGHFHFCGGEADNAPAIRAAVRRLVDEGADHIKLIASGGGTAGSAPEDCTYTVDDLRVAVDTAHELGRLTTAHCRSTESIRRAVVSGVDCIEHADFLRHDPGGGPIVRYDPEVVDLLRGAGTSVSMTMQCGGYDTLLELGRRESNVEPDRATMARIRAYFDDKLSILAALLRAGLADRIAVSTDAGPADTQFGRFALGLGLATEAGMTATQALVAATRTAARICGIADRAGLLRAGAPADLLVVGGRPTTSIEDAGDVRAVLVGGALCHGRLA
jgi:imidazolonepropionase-like amidohydrolase